MIPKDVSRNVDAVSKQRAVSVAKIATKDGVWDAQLTSGELEPTGIVFLRVRDDDRDYKP